MLCSSPAVSLDALCVIGVRLVSGKLPYLPLFVGDFLASTAEWTGEERSLYLLALMHQWSLGSLPADAAKLCRLLGWRPAAFRAAWVQVSTKFVERDGRLYNPRLEEHRERSNAISLKRAEAGKKGADRRWDDDGKSDGTGMASAKGLPSHPSHPIPTQVSGGSSDPGSEGDSSPVLPSTARQTVNATGPEENRRRLAIAARGAVKGVL